MSDLAPWQRLGRSRLLECRVFDVDEIRFQPPRGGTPRSFYRIVSPDWVNVVPLTDDGRVVLLRQYRFGVEDFTLEIPGGMCDAGEAPAEAALRELREETGYHARELTPLGWVHPNPALQENRCHCYVASGLELAGPPTPDETEELETCEVPLAEIPALMRQGAITHALVVSAFHLLASRERGI